MFESLQHAADMTELQSHSDIIKKHKTQIMPGISRFPENTPIAMAYVPMQQWKETYDIEDGFCRGTVFPELDLPFAPKENCL